MVFCVSIPPLCYRFVKSQNQDLTVELSKVQRLAVLYFLEREGIAAHLVNLYFYGERERAGWQCPQSASEWEKVIRDEEAWLGIGLDHSLVKRVHHVFLAVNPLAL